MQALIEAAVGFVGWITLKALTLGRYQSRGQRDLLVEGGAGLTSIALAVWLAYAWWPR